MNITVHNAELIAMRGRPMWALLVEVEGKPGRLMHLMPAETFENMAAEYGIDPDDWDTLLDLVLYSPHVADPVDVDDPKALYNAASVDEAREHLLGKVRAAKGNGRIRGVAGKGQRPVLGPSMPRLATADGADPVGFIKQRSPMSRSVVAVKTGLVTARRDRVRVERAQQPAVKVPSDAERAAAAQRRQTSADRPLGVERVQPTPDRSRSV